MKKQTKPFYFKHECGDTHKLKFRKLIKKMGLEGMGIYWALVEVLIDFDGKYSYDEIEELAEYIFTTKAKLERVICTLKDIDVVDGYIVSQYADEKLDEVYKRQQVAKNGGNKKEANRAQNSVQATVGTTAEAFDNITDEEAKRMFN